MAKMKMVHKAVTGNCTVFGFRHNSSRRAKGAMRIMVKWDWVAVEKARNSHTPRGPVSSMSGDEVRLPLGLMECDVHQDRSAVVRLQGETDSFGAEFNFLCDECLKDAIKSQEEFVQQPYECDWCGKKAVLSEVRDYSEGMFGPVYCVCPACRSAQNKRAQEEMEEMEDDDDRELDEHYARTSEGHPNYQPNVDDDSLGRSDGDEHLK